MCEYIASFSVGVSPMRAPDGGWHALQYDVLGMAQFLVDGLRKQTSRVDRILLHEKRVQRPGQGQILWGGDSAIWVSGVSKGQE